jgi:hypothetical protein
LFLDPTQKPVEVLKPLIASFCPADGLVLDPFCGSGLTLVAAKELGRRYVGIEIEGAHCHTAARRLEIARLTTCRPYHLDGHRRPRRYRAGIRSLRAPFGSAASNRIDSVAGNVMYNTAEVRRFMNAGPRLLSQCAPHV